MFNYYFFNMDIFQLICWFYIYSFLGWCMECVVIRHELGHWENRGFTKLPFCVIYGMGTLIALYLFDPIKDNYIALYLASAICATLVELFTAKVMQRLFGEVWWNYSHKRFNYKGVICLESTLAWGFLCLFIFHFINNQIRSFIFMVNHGFIMAIGTMVLTAYMIDFAFHFAKCIMGKRESQDFMNNGFE